MTHLLFDFARVHLGFDGVEFKFPVSLWTWWPKTSYNNGLMFLRNSFFHDFNNVSWHSDRHFPQYHSLRYRVLKAVSKADINELEACLN